MHSWRNGGPPDRAGQGRAAHRGGSGGANDHANACQHKRAVAIGCPTMSGRQEPAGVQGIVINATREEDRESSELVHQCGACRVWGSLSVVGTDPA